MQTFKKWDKFTGFVKARENGKFSKRWPSDTGRPPVMLHPVLQQVFEEIKRRDINLHWLAEQSGVGFQTLVAYRLGQRQPSILKLQSILDALGLELSLTPKNS